MYDTVALVPGFNYNATASWWGKHSVAAPIPVIVAFIAFARAIWTILLGGGSRSFIARNVRDYVLGRGELDRKSQARQIVDAIFTGARMAPGEQRAMAKAVLENMRAAGITVDSAVFNNVDTAFSTGNFSNLLTHYRDILRIWDLESTGSNVSRVFMQNGRIQWV